jgi:hypothetical protein
MNRKTLYIDYYFQGEHDLCDLLKSRYLGKQWDEMPHISVLMDSTSIENMIILGLTDQDKLKASLKEKWDLEIDYDLDMGTNILELTYPENLDKDELMNNLYNIAIEVMDNSGGDDDFFDYTPGLVNAITDIMTGLGYKEAAQLLQDEMEKRGHND